MSTLSEILSLQHFLFSFGLAVIIGLLGWLAKALSASGMLAAAVIGTLIFGLGGWPWAALLLAFFISSSLLSKLFSARKREVSEKFAKGSRRDWGQVFANGALGAFLVVIHLLFPEDVWPWLAYAGAMATVNADTWATELGVLSPVLPRLITSGKQVPPGTSGGISLTGTTATFAGGALIGLVGWLFDSSLPGLPFILVVAVAGLFGSLVDSLLGATVQAIYYDPVRDKETERRIFNEDGTLAAPIRGTDWMNNDMVNLIAGMAGALAAAALWQWWFV